MSEHPPLPTHVSADGRELWDWAAKAAETCGRNVRIAQLREQIAKRRCGGCRCWMTDKCPREQRGPNGQTMKGPHMFAPPCSYYDEKRWVKRRRDEQTAELAALLSEATREYPEAT